MKKISEYFKLSAAIIVFATLVAGCGQKGSIGSGNTTDTTVTDTMSDSAYDKGIEIVGLMDEMVHSDKYISIMSAGGEIEKKADEIAEGRYESPSQVFCLSGFSQDAMISIIGGKEAVEGLSDELTDFLNRKMAGGIISQINAQEGSVALATTSIFSANNTFVCKDISEDSIYLYIYPDSYPAAVVFNRGENSTVSATGYYLLNEDIRTADEKDTQQKIEDLFKMYGCKIEEITG